MINDILDHLQVKSGSLNLAIQRFNLVDSVKEVVKLIKFQTKKKDLRLTLDFIGGIPYNFHITTDPLRLKQVLLNLLSNALKFTFDGIIIFLNKKQSFISLVNIIYF